MRVYLDHAATTPLRAEAREAWVAAHEVLGNPSSIHGAGQDARRLLEDARDVLADVLGCQSIEVVLTSGGTEAANLALKGLWWSRAAGADAVVLPDGEHHATLDVVGWLAAAQGAAVRRVGLDPLGRIGPSAFADALPGAALATALVANNEVGTIQDAAALAAAASAAGVPFISTRCRRSGRSPSTSPRGAGRARSPEDWRRCRSRRTRSAGRSAWGRPSSPGTRP